MSKKKLLEFGLKEADAFQKNFKIIFDRLVRGYRSMMGKEPEGLDLLKVKMEAREKALNTTKVVNQKGLTLDPDKPIVGGTQEGIETIQIKELDDFNLSKDDPMGDLEKIVKGEGDTGLPKNYTRPFGDNIRDAYSKAGRDRKDATEMIEALDSPGAKKSYEIMEESLGVRLYGDETFEELMQIKETGVHPRGEPPIKKADGGRIGFANGNGVFDEDAEKAALGKRVRELMDEGFDFGDAVKEAMKEGYKTGGRVGFALGGESIIGKDIGTIGGIMGAPTTEEDEFSGIAGQTAGIGLSSLLGKMFGPTVGKFMHTQIKNKALNKVKEINQKKARDKAVEQAQRNQTEVMAAANKAAGRGGYQAGYDSGFMGGKGTAAEMGAFADGGLASMFVEKR